MKNQKVKYLLEQGVISDKLADPKRRRKIKYRKKLALKKIPKVKSILELLNENFSRKETKLLMGIRFFAFFPFESKDLSWIILCTDIVSSENKEIKNTIEKIKKAFPDIKLKYASMYNLKYHSQISSKEGLIIN